MPSSTITHAERSAWESSSGLFQPSRPPELAGWQPDGKRLTYPAAESFPQYWYQGCRTGVHHLSFARLAASHILAAQRQSLAQGLICGFDAWSFCRPGSIRCEWAFFESLQHDDTRTMQKDLPDHRVTH